MPNDLSDSRSPNSAFCRISAVSSTERCPPDHSDNAPDRPIISVDMAAAWSAVNPIGLSKSPALAARPCACVLVRPIRAATSSAHDSTVRSDSPLNTVPIF